MTHSATMEASRSYSRLHISPDRLHVQRHYECERGHRAFSMHDRNAMPCPNRNNMYPLHCTFGPALAVREAYQNSMRVEWWIDGNYIGALPIQATRVVVQETTRYPFMRYVACQCAAQGWRKLDWEPPEFAEIAAQYMLENRDD